MVAVYYLGSRVDGEMELYIRAAMHRAVTTHQLINSSTLLYYPTSASHSL